MGCSFSKQEGLTAQPTHRPGHADKHSVKSAVTTPDGTTKKTPTQIATNGEASATTTDRPASPATTVPTLAPQVSRVYTESLSQVARDVAKDSQQAVLDFDKDSRFQTTGVTNGVTILNRLSSEGCSRAVAGKIVLPEGLGFTIDQVVEFLMNTEARSTWDSTLKRWRVIEKFENAEPPVCICWAATRNLSGVLDDRDFVFAMMAEKLSPTRTVISYRSLDLVDYPEGKYDLSLVRGTIVNSGYIVESLDGVIFVSLFEEIDLGGSAPLFLADRELDGSLLKLAGLHAAIASHEVSVPPVKSRNTAELAKSDGKVPEPAERPSTQLVAEGEEASLSEEGQRMMKIGLSAQKALLAFESDKSFKSKGKSGPVELSVRPQNGSEMQVVCGKMNWGKKYTISQVMEFLDDLSNKVNWDDQLIEGKVLKSYLNDGERRVTLNWTSYKGEMGVAGRDFVYAAVNEKVSGNKGVMTCRSVDLDEFPEHKFSAEACRGFIQNAGYVIEKVQNGDLMVSFYNQVDVRGSVPTWVVNKATMKQPMSLVPAFASIKNYEFKPAPAKKVVESAKTEKKPLKENAGESQTSKATPEGASTKPKSDQKAPKEAEGVSPSVNAEPDETALSDEGERMMKLGLDAQAALLAFENDKSFKSKGRSGPVEVSVRAQNGSEMQVVCGKMNWGKKYTISQVMEFLGDLTNKVNWDDQLIEGKLLKSYLNDGKREVTLSWTSYKGEMGVAGRDFIYAAVNEKVSENKGVMTCRSVDLDEFPEHKFSAEACRGFIQNAGYVIEKVQSGDLMVSFYNQVDVRGSVPTWVVNKATMKQPMSLVPAFASIKNYKFKPAPARKAAEPAKTEKVTPVEKPQTTQEPKTPEGSRSVVPAKPSSESAPELASPQAKMALDAGKAAQKALLGFEEDQAFKSQGRSGNVDLFVRPQTTTERQVVCGKMSFGKEYTIEQIMQFINDLALKETWDSQFQDGRVLETHAKSASFSLNLTWAAYKKEMGVAGRDFVYAVLTEMVSPTLGVIATRSVRRDDYAEHKFLATHCRGFIDNAGYVVHDVDGEKIVSFYNQVDVGRSVPTWIGNKAQMRQPTSLDATFSAMKKHKFWPPSSAQEKEAPEGAAGVSGA
ncbi:hypothetical protein FOZ61_000947 [Perkinsus olseni]|uniref:START domain-containing protein n=1 Tax=Perkinsus olseni TaxID=32597 RepID=A0A7J6LYD4_PEROL|nr:hypothetical protein FOZ61_000947 [Perkinsus olseni]